MKVAVYGTLRKKGDNYPYFMTDCKYLGSFRTEPIYKMRSLSSGSFPGIKKGGNTSVLMEVYDVNREQLEHLNKLEGFKSKNNKENHYERVIERSPYGRVFIYEYNKPFSPSQEKISLGDWIAYKKVLDLKKTED